MLMMLISSLSFVNKSLMISIFSFSTAKYNAVLLNYYKISFKYMLLNCIQIYVFKFYSNICFQIVFKYMFSNCIQIYVFKFYSNICFKI